MPISGDAEIFCMVLVASERNPESHSVIFTISLLTATVKTLSLLHVKLQSCFSRLSLHRAWSEWIRNLCTKYERSIRGHLSLLTSNRDLLTLASCTIVGSVDSSFVSFGSEFDLLILGSSSSKDTSSGLVM